MNGKKAKTVIMIIVLIFSQIQIIWSITYAITNIRDNFRAIDANIQEENVLRFQKYLEDSLNDLKLIAMEYKYNSDLYEYINNKDYASINSNFFRRFIEIDGTYYIGIVSTDNGEAYLSNDYYTTQKIKGIIKNIEDKIYSLQETYTQEYIDYYVYDNEIYMMYILPIYPEQIDIYNLPQQKQKYMILVQLVDEYFIEQSRYVLGFDPFIITKEDLGNDNTLMQYNKASSSKVKDMIIAVEGNPLLISESDDEYAYQQKGFYNKDGDLLFYIQARHKSQINVYLFSSYFILLIPQTTIQLVIIVILVMIVIPNDKRADNDKSVKSETHKEVKQCLDKINERQALYTSQLQKQLDDRVSKLNIKSGKNVIK